MKKKYILIILSIFNISLTECFIINMNINNYELIKKKINIKKNMNYVKLTRPEGLLYEIILPLTGGYMIKKNISIFTNYEIILVGLLSGLIASYNMVINDYFDYKNGTDKLKKNKILNKKNLNPEEVLIFSKILVLISYVLINLINNNLIRQLLSLSIIVSYIYTPVLKNIILIKNLSVAFIICLSFILGGLITDINKINELISPCIYLFFYIMWQELLLDILDKTGDEKNKIITIPVKFGIKYSNILGLIYLILGILLSYGINIQFIMIQIPSILMSIYTIKKDKIINKKGIKLSKLSILLSGLYIINK
jgi:4-hydroxybenzoate polyprenyltransferase